MTQATTATKAGTGASEAPTEMIEIIVAEDNIVQLTYQTRLIESLGYRAIPAQDGHQALALLRSTGAEIVLSDYRMPRMNGIELTRAIRQMPQDPYVHVILITGSEDAGVRAEALEAGADDFLSKDRDPIALRTRLRAASRLVGHARELSAQNRKLRAFSDRITADLRAAAHAQRQLLPDIDRDILGTHIASAFVPSAMVSGDMFGAFALDDSRLGFYAVDVSGHGIHASLLSVAIGHLITREFFANAVLRGAGPPDPAALVRDLNDRFSSSENDDYFTMFCGVFDADSGQLDFCQAAYPSPLYLGPEGEGRELGDGGFPVGMFPDVDYENHATTFEPGALIVICSDAASEAETPSGQIFGTARLNEMIWRHRSAAAEALPGLIVTELTTWRDGKALEDDLTVVVIKRTG